MKWDKATYRITDRGRFGVAAMTVMVIGAAASLVGLVVDRRQFFHSWLTAYMYWFTLAAGGLFFTMLHHLVGATWSVVLRRLAENIMRLLPFMLIAFVPIAFGMHDLFHWSHADAVATDALLQWKSGYLNIPFFLARAIIFFAVWAVLSRLLAASSLKQDGGHTPALARRFRRTSAPGMILFAVTMTLAAFDWLMSLDAHWYSTIFGVYIFAGALVAVLSFLPLISICLRSRGVLAETITVAHYHDMGKLLFAFVIFWAYMAFSQYFLIWYGNIPEETIWFLHRWEGSWKAVSLLIVFGHFVIPFFILITRGAKRNPAVLRIFAIWLLIMHWVDLYWVVMPGLHPHGAHLSWLDVSTMMAVGGAFLALFWRFFTARPLVPVGDPKLEPSIRLVNH